MGLKELQAKWQREGRDREPEGTDFSQGIEVTLKDCASALQPHIEHMEALENALWKYGYHTDQCYLLAGHYKDGVERKCDCGFEEARSILGAKEEGK